LKIFVSFCTGGVPVLQYGKLGKLIESPHFISEWEKSILEFLENLYLAFHPNCIQPKLDIGYEFIINKS
jgi:hypothetical protein